MTLREDANYIINQAIKECMPDEAVKRALKQINYKDQKIYLLAIGKAAWAMAKAASDYLGDSIIKGIVITKYQHIKEEIQNIISYEAGHPISDENTYLATEKAIEMVKDLKEDSRVLFLISGGGSSLFEKPLIDSAKLEDINKQLLASGADITEINTIRKRLSSVKAGRFAKICAPARVDAIILSDIIDNPIDMIASGPAYPDSSTCEKAFEIVDKYEIKIDDEVKSFLKIETPKEVDNVTTMVTGSVKELVVAAEKAACDLGYKSQILTDSLDIEASQAGYMLGTIGKTNKDKGPLAYILGGETVVTLTGSGMGGRNQELALAAAEKISGLDNVLIFSLGSDGTDGPTDAAGGIVGGQSKHQLEGFGLSIYDVLRENDSYHALEKINGLIKTGPTGTNVNDVAVLLIK